MATTFQVIDLGLQPIMDTTEGNTLAENTAAMVGLTFGTLEDPLWELTQTFSPGTSGFAGGTATAYDMDNTLANEQFRIDGGANQTFDGTSIFNATITYTDGTTADITAVLFQDTTGQTYLAPEFSANTDQVALQAGAIRSLTINSVSGDTYSGLTGDRQTTNFAVCFTSGTLIKTPDGQRPVEELTVGDMVETLDNGPQTIRWIGARTVPATGPMKPIVFDAGSLGPNLPARTMTVSRHHRLMLDNIVVERMTNTRQVLIPAFKLLNLPGVREAVNPDLVTYWHFLCDKHEIVFAEGAPAETLYLGQQARKSLSPQSRAEITMLFPDLMAGAAPCTPARGFLDGRPTDKLVERLQRNKKAAIAQI